MADIVRYPSLGRTAAGAREVVSAPWWPPSGERERTVIRDHHLSPEEAWLAERAPVAADVTVEADSGGHTDNRPLAAILPVILS